MFYLYFGIGIIFLILTILGIKVIHSCNKMFCRRYNGNPNLHYFEAKDFDGLNAEPIEFPSNKGQLLRGYIYTGMSSKNPKGLVIFSHGFGAGHQSYTTEINTLAQAGFTVVSYDNTACVHSEGKSVKGFDQGPIDLKYAIHFVQNDVRFKQFDGCILIGHSWGGFSVMNSIDNPFVRGVVSICGFVSSCKVLAQVKAKKHHKKSKARWIWRLNVPSIALYNKFRFGKEANRNAIKSLKNSNKPILMLYGAQDATVFFQNNGKELRKHLNHKKNVEFITYPRKGHNVYLTDEAEQNMNSVFGKIAAMRKNDTQEIKELYSKINYSEITEEDSSVMQQIIRFCLKH